MEIKYAPICCNDLGAFKKKKWFPNRCFGTLECSLWSEYWQWIIYTLSTNREANLVSTKSVSSFMHCMKRVKEKVALSTSGQCFYNCGEHSPDITSKLVCDSLIMFTIRLRHSGKSHKNPNRSGLHAPVVPSTNRVYAPRLEVALERKLVSFA